MSDLPETAPTMPDAAAPDAVPAAADPEPAAPPAAPAPAALAADDAYRSALTPDASFIEAAGRGLPWIPFALYLLIWIVLAGASAYLLWGATADLPARWLPAYEPLMWSGVALTVLGPVMAIAVWLAARADRPAVARRGLLASATARGALVTLFGVIIWLATLYALDLHATGRFL